MINCLFTSILFFFTVANIGGLLGLFMGFSCISVIEMFYFISIRPYFNYIRFSNKRRKLMMRVIRKMDKLRRKKRSPIILKKVQINSNFDGNDNNHVRYLD